MSNLPAIVIDHTGRDIHAEAERIRAHGPVARVELPGGVLAWSITGYHAVRQALADQRFSKDPRRHWTAFLAGQIGPDFPLIGWALMENLTTSYGEDHRRLRKLITGAFTTQRVEALRPAVQAAAADLLDRLAATPPGSMVDVKGRFANPLAARVIGDLVGVPVETRAGLQAGSDANVGTAGEQDAVAHMAEMRRQMGALIADRRYEPRADLTSGLIAAQTEDGSRLTDAEMTGTLLFLFAAGTEPVTNLLTNAVGLLLTHPAQRDAVRAGRVGWPEVIEETLRLEAPEAHLPFRFAVEDVEIGGVTIRRGDPVLIGYAGAGRDPAVHGDTADRFDPARRSKDHLSFGHGVYRCLGRPLALLEAEVALPALFARFPDMALAVTAERLQPQGTFIMNGIHALPVRLGDPAPAAC